MPTYSVWGKFLAAAQESALTMVPVWLIAVPVAPHRWVKDLRFKFPIQIIC